MPSAPRSAAAVVGASGAPPAAPTTAVAAAATLVESASAAAGGVAPSAAPDAERFERSPAAVARSAGSATVPAATLAPAAVPIVDAIDARAPALAADAESPVPAAAATRPLKTVDCASADERPPPALPDADATNAATSAADAPALGKGDAAAHAHVAVPVVVPEGSADVPAVSTVGVATPLMLPVGEPEGLAVGLAVGVAAPVPDCDGVPLGELPMLGVEVGDAELAVAVALDDGVGVALDSTPGAAGAASVGDGVGVSVGVGVALGDEPSVAVVDGVRDADGEALGVGGGVRVAVNEADGVALMLASALVVILAITDDDRWALPVCDPLPRNEGLAAAVTAPLLLGVALPLLHRDLRGDAVAQPLPVVLAEPALSPPPLEDALEDADAKALACALALGDLDESELPLGMLLSDELADATADTDEQLLALCVADVVCEPSCGEADVAADEVDDDVPLTAVDALSDGAAVTRAVATAELDVLPHALMLERSEADATVDGVGGPLREGRGEAVSVALVAVLALCTVDALFDNVGAPTDALGGALGRELKLAATPVADAGRLSVPDALPTELELAALEAAALGEPTPALPLAAAL